MERSDLKSLPISKVQDLPLVSPAFAISLDPGQGDIGTSQLQKGPIRRGPELRWHGGASGPARDTQRWGPLGSSGALSTVLPRAEPQELPSEAAGSDS